MKFFFKGRHTSVILAQWKTKGGYEWPLYNLDKPPLVASPRPQHPSPNDILFLTIYPPNFSLPCFQKFLDFPSHDHSSFSCNSCSYKLSFDSSLSSNATLELVHSDIWSSHILYYEVSNIYVIFGTYFTSIDLTLTNATKSQILSILYGVDQSFKILPKA